MEAAIQHYLLVAVMCEPLIVNLLAFIEYLEGNNRNYFRYTGWHVVLGLILSLIPFFNVLLACCGVILTVVAGAMWLWGKLMEWDTKGRFKKAYNWLDGLTLWPR